MVRREWVVFGCLWAGLSAVGLGLVLAFDLLPPAFAREAEIVDEAWRLMLLMGVPVLTFVLAMVITIVLRFRVPGNEPPTVDGPDMQGSRGALVGWLAVTSALCLVLILNPGLVGLRDVRGDARADRVVEVQGQRWFWIIRYPEAGIEIYTGAGLEGEQGLVLPAGERIRFDVTAPEGDVLHSFWIPAFRTKIDAVPGRVTHVYITPEEEGSYEDDPGLRLQCAELCGLNHARMAAPVSVLPPGEFEAWLQEQAAATEGATAGDETAQDAASESGR